MGKPEIKNLTSIRGIAAILVVAFHASGHLFLGRYIDLGSDMGGNFIGSGYLWVDMFFILSGFVITYSERSYFENVTSAREYWLFIIRRFARVYPLHFVTLIIFVFFEIVKIVTNTGHDLLLHRPDFVIILGNNLLLTHSWGTLGSNYFNYPSWSISAEWGAYLLFPVLTNILIGRSIASRLILMVVALVALEAVEYIISGQLWVIDLSYQFGLVRSLTEFAIGVLVFGIYTERHRYATIQFFGDDYVLVALVTLTAFSMTMKLPDIVCISEFACLVLSLSLNRGFSTKIISARPVHFLGEISYSIYMMHAVLLNVLFTAIEASGIEISTTKAWGIACLYLCALIPISAATYRLIEIPARRFVTEKLA